MVSKLTALEIITVHTVENPNRAYRPIRKAEGRHKAPKADEVLWRDGKLLKDPYSIHPGFFWAVCEGHAKRVKVVIDRKSGTFMTREEYKALKQSRKPVTSQKPKESKPKGPAHVNQTFDGDGREAGTSHRCLTHLPRSVTAAALNQAAELVAAPGPDEQGHTD